MKKIIFYILFSYALTLNAQNVGINGDGSSPDNSAMLDVKASDKGMLIPRVQLDDASTASPIASPTEGLMIYNQTGTEDKGFWFWSGNQWTRMASNNNEQGGGNAGTIVSYAGETLPNGFLVCDGSAVSRTTYADLYTAIGIVWGAGDGATTFNLPDLRGNFLRGIDAGAGNDPNSSTRTAKFILGNSGDNVGSYQDDATARPNSNFTTNTTGNHSHSYYRYQDYNGNPDGATDTYTGTAYQRRYWRGRVTANTSTTGNHNHYISTGGDAETRPKNANINFIIQYLPGAGSGFTESQSLSVVGNDLSITDGNTITIPQQSLSLSGNDLTISDGNTVSFTFPNSEDSTRLIDTDKDTKIQVEKSADEDIIRFDVAGVEAMVIDSNTNVGIGETSPSEKLHIKNGSLKIDDGTNPYTFPSADGTANQVMLTDGGGNISWTNINKGGLVGSIVSYGGASLPNGFLVCDGSAVSRTTYADLYTAIGIVWGAGDGATTFNLPDLRGIFLRGIDAGAGNDPNSSTRTAKFILGNSGDNVGSYQGDATARPNTNFTTNTTGNHSHSYYRYQDYNGNPDGATDTYTGTAYQRRYWRGRVTANTSTTGNHNHSITGGGDAETRPKNANINFIIQYLPGAGSGSSAIPQTISVIGNDLSISNGNSLTLPTQNLSLSGNDLTISNGNTVSFSIPNSEDSTRLTDADNDTKIQVEKNVDEDIIRFDVAGTEVMVIDNTANIGIGETNPTEKLHIKNGSLKIDNGTNPYTLPNADGFANQIMKTDGNGNLTWSSTPTPSPIIDVQIDNVTRTYTNIWALGSVFNTINGFAAGSKVKLTYNIPLRNNSYSWGGGYIEPQISFDNGTTWNSLGSSGYDGGVMSHNTQTIGSYSNTILIDPLQVSVFSVKIRFYFRSYENTLIQNGNHDINNISGTAPLMSGDNSLQHFTKAIIEEIF